MSTVTREDLIQGSLNLYVREGLAVRGFPPDSWQMLESFPYGQAEPLTVNLIAAGFAFDDGGKQAELGSNLKERQHTAEFFVFGLTNTWAQNLANAIKFSLEQDPNGMLPLRDVTDQPEMPTVDWLYLDAVFSHHQPIADPEAFSEFTWVTTVKVTDIYNPSST
jgi:hypothetical protein